MSEGGEGELGRGLKVVMGEWCEGEWKEGGIFLGAWNWFAEDRPAMGGVTGVTLYAEE